MRSVPRSAHLSRAARLAPAAAALLAGAVRAAAAQDAAPAAAPDARWQAWYGCWSAAPDSADRAAALARSELPVTCVSPAGGSAVEVTTVAAGRVTARDRVDASGAPRRFEREGCSGSERGEWSPDGRRLYLRSDLTCANNVRRTGDGVFAFARGGDWLDVRGATVGGYTGVRTVRYRPAAEPAALPADVSAALRGRALAVETARVAASAPASADDVVEVTRRAGAPVAAAWLAELRQRFALTGRELAGLADAGVPGSVTDVLVATTYPQRFALGPSGPDPVLRPTADADAPRPGPVAVLSPAWGGLGGWGGWGWNALGFSPFGYSAFGPGLGYGLGYLPRGGYWGAGPVVVVRPAPGVQARAVPGRGYTQGDNPSSGGARPVGGRSSAGDSWGSGPSMSRGGYSGGGSSGSGGGSSTSSGGGRTAKPRP